MAEKQAVAGDSLSCAREVIAQEIAGLEAVNECINEQFLSVVDLVDALKGRLIVTGMGKSGHIARKIAATLASTGTPAHFVHPSEASHGDLGMITPDDAVMCLSNSGETAELSDIIHYCKRYRIPLIALVRRAQSMLVETADIAVVLPEVPEASPTGAPTTSTMMMLAYGDALAVALLEKRGFTREDFGKFHPGGKLGQALIRTEQLMHIGDEMPLVPKDMAMQDVLIAITGKRFGCVGVMENDKLVGMITDGDLRRHIGPDMLQQTAEQVMTANPITITPQTLASEALGIMQSKRITSLFALDADGKPAGIIHIHDYLRAGVE